MLLLRITVLEFPALLQHSIALYCVLPVIKLRYWSMHCPQCAKTVTYIHHTDNCFHLYLTSWMHQLNNSGLINSILAKDWILIFVVFNATFNNISAISLRSVYRWRKLEYPEKTAEVPIFFSYIKIFIIHFLCAIFNSLNRFSIIFWQHPSYYC